MYNNQDIIDYFGEMPAVLRNVADTANTDLYHGPVYTDGKGEWLDWCDPDAKQFNFTRACSLLSDWLDEHTSETYYEDWSGCLTNTLPEEMTEFDVYYAISRHEVAKAYLGKELAEYV